MSTYQVHPDRQAGSSSRGGVAAAAARGRGGRGGGGGGRARASSQQSNGGGEGIPSGSISKLKAQLRQTKRLLARDDLTPDVRTTTERRLATLETELGAAERATLEKKRAVRYRGVRFFERQKCLRKIRQALRTSTSSAASNDPALFDARADLYYVLHFPKQDKYIALFPEGNYVPFNPQSPAPSSSSSASDATMKNKTKGSVESEKKRWTLRKGFREMLEKGTVKMEVEEGYLGIEGEADPEEREKGSKRARVVEEEEEEEDEEEGGKEGERKKVKLDAGEKTEKTKSVESTSKKLEEQKGVPELPGKASTDPASEVKEVQHGRETKKERKDRKDAKRRELKAAKTTTETNAKVAKGWAGDDDFFA